MRLAAIYIIDYYFDTKLPDYVPECKVINLGGKNIYSGEIKDETLEIDLIVNDKYVDDILNSSKVKGISAIVGSNGAGKTSLLNRLSEIHKGHYDYFSGEIYEDENRVIVSIRGDQKYNVNFKHETSNPPFKERNIYYSPFIDFKKEAGDIDVSADSFMASDLEEFDPITKGPYSFTSYDYLKRTRTKRVYDFIKSDVGKEISAYYDLPPIQDDIVKITFNRFRIDIVDKALSFHNTPYGLRPILNRVFKEAEQESRDNNANRSKDYKLHELQRRQLKHYFLIDVLTSLVYKMEERNTFLNEGHLLEEIDDAVDDAKSLLFFLLDNHSYDFGGVKFKPLPVNETKDFINIIYKTIDDLNIHSEGDKTEFDWDRRCIYIPMEKAEEILVIQDAFKNKLQKYYSEAESKDERNNTRFLDLVNVEFFKRRLSSGEMSLISLFSSFYTHFNTPFKEKVDLYLFYIDEGDLGFHPQWKKKYVTGLLTFFEALMIEVKSTCQIVFTTHDPLTLSDIPNYSITYLDKDEKGYRILQKGQKPTKSFGANISDLLADSFFVGDGLIGDFAKNKINETIKWLNNENRDLSIKEEHRKLISNIDEPVVRRKLSSMYDDAMGTELEAEALEAEYDRIREILKKKFPSRG